MTGNHQKRREILEQRAAECSFQTKLLALEDFHVAIVWLPLHVAVRFYVDDFHAANKSSWNLIDLLYKTAVIVPRVASH